MTTRKLSDIAEVNVGYSFKGKAESSSNNGEIKLLQIKDIREGTVKSTQHLPYANIDSTKVRNCLVSGSLLMPLRGDRHAATLLQFGSTPESVITTNQVAILRTICSEVLPEFLLWYFNSSYFKNIISNISTGSTISNIRITTLKDIQIPIPSIKVQEKIISIYRLWKEEESTLKDLLINGERMTEAVCLNLVSK